MHLSLAANQACNLGGHHDATGSWNFALPHGTPETGDAQSAWRFCTQCSNLFWEKATEQHCYGGWSACGRGLGIHAAPSRRSRLRHRTGQLQPAPGWLGPADDPAERVVHLRTHAHDSGATNIEYVFGAVLVNRYGQPFAFGHTGHVEGTTGALFGTPDR